ncbi:unnamed protein product, partial [Amoebophrya sp. A25]
SAGGDKLPTIAEVFNEDDADSDWFGNPNAFDPLAVPPNAPQGAVYVPLSNDVPGADADLSVVGEGAYYVGLGLGWRQAKPKESTQNSSSSAKNGTDDVDGIGWIADSGDEKKIDSFFFEDQEDDLLGSPHPNELKTKKKGKAPKKEPVENKKQEASKKTTEDEIEKVLGDKTTNNNTTSGTSKSGETESSQKVPDDVLPNNSTSSSSSTSTVQKAGSTAKASAVQDKPSEGIRDLESKTALDITNRIISPLGNDESRSAKQAGASSTSSTTVKAAFPLRESVAGAENAAAATSSAAPSAKKSVHATKLVLEAEDTDVKAKGQTFSSSASATATAVFVQDVEIAVTAKQGAADTGILIDIINANVIDKKQIPFYTEDLDKPSQRHNLSDPEVRESAQSNGSRSRKAPTDWLLEAERIEAMRQRRRQQEKAKYEKSVQDAGRAGNDDKNKKPMAKPKPTRVSRSVHTTRGSTQTKMVCLPTEIVGGFYFRTTAAGLKCRMKMAHAESSCFYEIHNFGIEKELNFLDSQRNGEKTKSIGIQGAAAAQAILFQHIGRCRFQMKFWTGKREARSVDDIDRIKRAYHFWMLPVEELLTIHPEIKPE